MIWCVFNQYFLRPIDGKYRTATALLVKIWSQSCSVHFSEICSLSNNAFSLKLEFVHVLWLCHNFMFIQSFSKLSSRTILANAPKCREHFCNVEIQQNCDYHYQKSFSKILLHGWRPSIDTLKACNVESCRWIARV